MPKSSKTDPDLGLRIYNRLMALGLEQLGDNLHHPRHAKVALSEGVRGAFEALNLDPKDPSTKDTPHRYADMFVDELTYGLNYANFPKCTATPNHHHAHEDLGRIDEMVLVANITSISLCEHHLQTIDGIVHVAYIPGKTVLGLSKFARIVDFFSRRPQIQERMTAQISAALQLILETEDVAVIARATHFCMRARGVGERDATTTTQQLNGRFRSNPSLRQELFHAISESRKPA